GRRADDAPHGARSRAVPFRPRQPATERPAAVAVHDDRDVQTGAVHAACLRARRSHSQAPKKTPAPVKRRSEIDSTPTKDLERYHSCVAPRRSWRRIANRIAHGTPQPTTPTRRMNLRRLERM